MAHFLSGIDIDVIVSSQWAIHLARSYQFAKLQIDTSNSMPGNIPGPDDSRRIRNDP